MLTEEKKDQSPMKMTWTEGKKNSGGTNEGKRRRLTVAQMEAHCAGVRRRKMVFGCTKIF